MSHEITIRTDGFAEAAFARTPAWHNLGQVLPREMTSAEALTEAGLDWKVEQEIMGRFVGQDVTNPQPGDWKPCVDTEGEPTVLANVRGDTGLYLGNVSRSYRVVQNHEAFKFLDSLVDNEELQYEAAFSLSGGRKVVILARMPGVYSPADGDEILPYVMFSNHHDGSGAIKFGPTAVRIVCANTYALALSSDTKGRIGELSFRHSAKLDEQLEHARALLSRTSQKMEAHAQACNIMANHRMNKSDWEAFIDIMCPRLNRLDPDWTERREKAIAETRKAINLEYHSEDNDFAPMTAWAAFNAVTAHIDHLPRRGATPARKAEARFNVTQYGAGRDQKTRAFVAACRLADVAEELITLAG